MSYPPGCGRPGEKIDPARHRLYRSVKAATFNQLHIGAGEARIVFDV